MLQRLLTRRQRAGGKTNGLFHLAASKYDSTVKQQQRGNAQSVPNAHGARQIGAAPPKVAPRRCAQ
eukprot:1561421-Pleurochrysis_carterae.AAC.3